MSLLETTNPRRRREPGIVLALGGGGARGLAHLGVLSVLEDAGIPVRGIAGTSAGSVIGAMWLLHPNARSVRERWEAFLASGLLPDLPELHFSGELSTRDNLLQLVRTFKLKSVRSLALGHQSLVTKDEFDRALAFLVGDASFAQLRQPFAAVACDFETGLPVMLRSGDFRTSLAASCAIPAVLPPYRIDDRVLVDGGVVAEIPVEQALSLARGPVIAVDISDAPVSEDLDGIAPARALLRAGLLAQRALRRWSVAASRLVLRPEVQHISILDFRRSEEVIEAGKAIARQHLSTIRTIAGISRTPHAPTPGLRRT